MALCGVKYFLSKIINSGREGCIYMRKSLKKKKEKLGISSVMWNDINHGLSNQTPSEDTRGLQLPVHLTYPLHALMVYLLI